MAKQTRTMTNEEILERLERGETPSAVARVAGIGRNRVIAIRARGLGKGVRGKCRAGYAGPRRGP